MSLLFLHHRSFALWMLRLFAFLASGLAIFFVQRTLPVKFESIQQNNLAIQEANLQLELVVALKKDAAELMPYLPKVEALVPIVDFNAFQQMKRSLEDKVHAALGISATLRVEDPAPSTAGFQQATFLIRGHAPISNIRAFFSSLGSFSNPISITKLSVRDLVNASGNIEIVGFVVFRSVSQ